MKNNEIRFKEYFYGNKISEYGREHGYVDYATLAKSFDAVLNNSIMGTMESAGYYFEQESGFTDNSEEIEALEAEREEAEEAENTERVEEIEREIEELEADQEEQPEIFQFYIVSDQGAEILKEFNEIVFYCDTLDMYIWGVTHWGTAWDYVLTNIKCEKTA